jgi:hypothetical protein
MLTSVYVNPVRATLSFCLCVTCEKFSVLLLISHFYWELIWELLTKVKRDFLSSRSTESEKRRGIRLESEDLVNKLQVVAAATTEIPHLGCEERLSSERLWAPDGTQITSICGLSSRDKMKISNLRSLRPL